VGGQHHFPAPLPSGGAPIPILETLAPEWFEPQTIQPVASPYTSYVILAFYEVKVTYKSII